MKILRFKVYRGDDFIGEVETSRRDANTWSPVENLVKGDILENVSDGARLVVELNNPDGYTRPGLRLRLIQ